MKVGTPLYKLSLLLPGLLVLAHSLVGAHPALSPNPDKNGNIAALNSCIEYLNETVFLTRWLQQGLVAYNMHANYYNGVNFTTYDQNASLSISVDKFQLPTALFNATQNKVGELGSDQSAGISKNLDSIQATLEHLEFYYQELQQYLDSKAYKADNLDRSTTLLKRFERLFRKLDSQILETYQSTYSLYTQHTKPGENSTWGDMYQAMQKTMEDDHDLLDQFKYHFFHPEDSSTERLTALAQEIEETVTQIPSWVFRSRASQYTEAKLAIDEIKKASRKLAEKGMTLKPQLLDDQFTFERITYQFNQTTVFFNKFVEGSGQEWLLYPQQLFLFKYIPPSGTPLADSGPSNLPLASGLSENEVSLEGFAPAHLVFLLDISRSMRAPSKLPLLKESLGKLIPILRPIDTVSIISFSGKAEVVLPPTALRKQNAIIASLDSLLPSGTTELDKGLNMAYKVANEHLIQGGNNRIILATDGLFPVDKRLVKMVKYYSQSDIHLSVFNFGGNTEDRNKLIRLANKGKGNFANISLENADQKLLEELMSKKEK